MFLQLFLCVVCVVQACDCMDSHLCTHIWWWENDIMCLLYYIPPYSLETVSLNEPEAKRCFGWLPGSFQDPSATTAQWWDSSCRQPCPECSLVLGIWTHVCTASALTHGAVSSPAHEHCFCWKILFMKNLNFHLLINLLKFHLKHVSKTC